MVVVMVMVEVYGDGVHKGARGADRPQTCRGDTYQTNRTHGIPSYRI